MSTSAQFIKPKMMEECPLCVEPYTLAHHLRVKHGMIHENKNEKRKRKLPLKPVIKEKKRKTKFLKSQKEAINTEVTNEETDVVANQKEATDDELSN